MSSLGWVGSHSALILLFWPYTFFCFLLWLFFSIDTFVKNMKCFLRIKLYFFTACRIWNWKKQHPQQWWPLLSWIWPALFKRRVLVQFPVCKYASFHLPYILHINTPYEMDSFSRCYGIITVYNGVNVPTMPEHNSASVFVCVCRCDLLFSYQGNIVIYS